MRKPLVPPHAASYGGLGLDKAVFSGFPTVGIAWKVQTFFSIMINLYYMFIITI